MNSILCAPFSEDEFRKAPFDMHPDKTPCPDGMFAFFYKKFWSEVGKEVTSAVLRLLNEGK